MNKTIVSLALLLAALTNPLSATVLCPTADVTTLTTGCTDGSLVVKDFVVDWSADFTHIVFGIASATNGALAFTVATDPSVITEHLGAWWRIGYEVDAPAPWLDKVTLNGIVGSQLWIYETVCRSSFSANFGECPTADLVGQLAAAPGMSVSLSFAGVSKLFLKKQGVLGDAWSTNFTNTVHAAPEPATLLIVGVPLVLIGLKRMKKGRR